MNNIAIEYTKEDVDNLARIIVNSLVNVEEKKLTAIFYITNSAIEIESLEDITRFVDLDLMSNIVLGLTDPIGQLANWLASKFSWIIDSLRNIFSTIISGFVSGIKEFINMVVGGVKWIVSNLYKFVQSAVSNIMGFLRSIGSTLSSLWNYISGAISNAINSIISGVKGFIAGLQSFIQSIGNVILSTLNTVISIAQSIIGQIANAIGRIGSMIWSAIGNVINTVTSLFGQLSSIVSNFFGQVFSTLSNIFAQLSGLISSAIGSITSFISNIGQTIISLITNSIQTITSVFNSIGQTILSTLTNLFSTISNLISSAIGTLSNIVTSIGQSIMSFITNIGQSILSTLTNIFSSLSALIGNILSTVGSFFSQIIQNIWSAFSKFGQFVISSVSNFFNQIAKFFTSIANTVTSLFTRLLQNIGGLFANLGKQIWSWIQGLGKMFSSAFEAIQKFFGDIASKIASGFALIGNALTGFINAILRFPEWFPKWFYEHIAKPIVDGFKAIGEWIWKMLPDFIKEAFEKIRDFFTKVWKGIVSFFSDPIGSLQKAFSEIGQWIWNALPDFMKDFFTKVKDFFTKVWDGIVNFFKDPLGNIKKAFNSLAKWIWDHLPDPIKTAFEKIRDFFVHAWDFLTKSLPKFFEKLYNGIVSFVQDPIGTLTKYVVRPLIETFSHVFDSIINIFRSIGKTLSNVFSEIVQFFADIGKFIITNVVQGIYKIGEGLKEAITFVVEPIVKFFRSLLQNVSLTVRNLVTGKVKPAGEFDAIGIVLADVIKDTLAFWSLAFAITGISMFIPDIVLSLAPEGVGSRFKVKLKNAFKEFGDYLKKGIGEFIKGLTVGFGMSFGEILLEGIRHYANMAFRNFVPIEIPTLTEGKHLVERAFATDRFEEVLSKYKLWLEMRGFADYIINLLIAKPEEYKIEITDRFGRRRIVPLSYIFELPTISEICKMMMRDMFASYSDFVKIMKARGVVPDLSYLFYLLHYKYPSPEKLWEFTCRAIAGETWYVPSPEEIKQASIDAQSVGAYVPKYTPADLAQALKNPAIANIVFDALGTYMKWHDYARFSWMDNWTSDNWLIIDILPDIPGKIDLRWMSKWGIFEAWSAWGITLENTIEEITRSCIGKTAEAVYKRLLSSLQSTTVELDVRQYCRLLQADKLHPYWVPWVAIAETINVLSEERTLLRTGFWNLYKEGLLNKDLLDQLFAGFFTVKFKVGYFDIKTRKWTTGEVEIPVMYLPPEAKLIEIRCVMDRAVDIFRDLQREIMYGIREAIFTHDVALMLLKGFVEDAGTLNKTLQSLGMSTLPKFVPFGQWFESIIEKITGKKGIKLIIDSDWATYYSIVYYITSYIEMVRRLRYWLSRIIAWAIYRLAYGYVRKEDVYRLIDIVGQRAKLLPYEIDALKELAYNIVGVVRREYVPTPYQLATIAEYVPKVRKFVDKVLEARNVPEEWRPIWKEYIDVRPIYNDIRRIVTRIIGMYSYGAVAEKDFTKALEIIKPFGYEDREIEFIKLDADYYRAERIWRQVYPSWIGLTAYYRYVQEALDLLRKKLDLIFNFSRLKELLPWIDTKTLIQFYVKLAINRSVYLDVRRYITELITSYAHGVISDKEFEEELKYLQKYGLNEHNIELIKKCAQLRRRRYSMRYHR